MNNLFNKLQYILQFTKQSILPGQRWLLFIHSQVIPGFWVLISSEKFLFRDLTQREWHRATWRVLLPREDAVLDGIFNDLQKTKTVLKHNNKGWAINRNLILILAFHDYENKIIRIKGLLCLLPFSNVALMWHNESNLCGIKITQQRTLQQ